MCSLAKRIALANRKLKHDNILQVCDSSPPLSSCSHLYKYNRRARNSKHYMIL